MVISKQLEAFAWAALALLLWSPVCGYLAGSAQHWVIDGKLPTPFQAGINPAALILFAIAAVPASVFAARATRRAADERLRDLAQSNFAAAVTHELRTPVTTIKMYAEMLSQGLVTDPAARQRFLDGIVHECHRLDGLVEDVLSFAAVSEGRAPFKPEALPIDALLDEALDEVQAQLRAAGLVVERDVPPGLTVWADRRAMTRVIANLLGNAAKYAADGKLVHLSAGPAAKGVAIAVRDFGPGIPSAERKKVFEPFYRVGSELTRQKPGTGLGLALVRHWVAGQDGTVAVEAAAGGPGTVFTITLPRPVQAA